MENDVNQCVFCKKMEKEEDSIPTFWVDDTEYCAVGQCVCHECAKSELVYDKEHDVFFLPNTRQVPEGTKVFMPRA